MHIAGDRISPSMERPDCVIIDPMMAKLDGLELCEELRARKETGDATPMELA
jgi:CheY-like chemotaxis protein